MHFPILKITMVLLAITGAVLFFGGIVGGLMGVLVVHDLASNPLSKLFGDAWVAIIALLATISGIVFLAQAEILLLNLTIEENTRKTYEAIDDVLEHVQLITTHTANTANNSAASTKLQARATDAMEALASTIPKHT